MPADVCATWVYGKCGKDFKERLQKMSGFNRIELCKVFVAEGSCIIDAKPDFNCTESQVLNRFKQNSDYTGYTVLQFLCPRPQPI